MAVDYSTVGDLEDTDFRRPNLPRGTVVPLEIMEAKSDETPGKSPCIIITVRVPSGEYEGYSFTQRCYMTGPKPGAKEGATGAIGMSKRTLRGIAAAIVGVEESKRFFNGVSALSDIAQALGTLSGHIFTCQLGVESQQGFPDKQVMDAFEPAKLAA